MAKLLTDASADRLLRLFAALGGEPAQRARGGVRGWLPVLVVANSATAVGGSAVGNQCFDASVVVVNSQDSTQDVGADVWLTVLSGVGSVVTPTVNTVYEGVYAGLFDASGDERLRVFAVPGSSSSLTEGSAALASDWAITTSGNEDISVSVVLPSAGTYRINCSVTGTGVVSSVGTSPQLFGKIYDVTNSVYVRSWAVLNAAVASLTFQAVSTVVFDRTVGGATTLRIDVARASGSTWTTSTIGGSSGGNVTEIGYLKLS